MVLEAAIRDQRIDSVRETDGAIASTGVFVPFGDVVKRFSWTPNASIEPRRGIGSVDSVGFDTGPESHSVTVSYLLQGAMATAAALNTGLADDSDQITWTANKAGHDGNNITVTLIAGTADAGGISVIGNDISCEVGTATVADFVTLINNDSDVAALVTASAHANSDSASVVQAYAVGTLSAGDSTPLAEAFNRDCDGQLEARTIVMREKHCEGGTANYGKRTYVVLEGCKPASARIPGDPGTAGPIEVEITYTAEKGRQYELSQPSSAGVFYVTSSETADYNATVTVEDDDGTQEEIVVSGTGSTSFSSFDALELASELTGTLTVQMADSAGATLAVVYGSNDYANAEGDLGVPVIPSAGSRTASLGTDYEKFLGDTITHSGGVGSALAYDINSAELSVDNSITALPRNNTRKQRIIEGNRVLQLTATVMGEAEYQNQVTRHLQASTGNIVWTLTDNTISLWGAVLSSLGDKNVEEGGAFMQFDNTFSGTSITIA